MERIKEQGMEIKAVIFDLDGVLVFTDEYHYRAWKRMADEIGVYFDRSINDRLRGVSRMASLEIILERFEKPELSAEEKTVLAEKKNGYYRELLGTMTPADVTANVKFTLDRLRNDGYKLAIGSSSKNTKYILERVDLLDRFDAISDGTNITRSKPDPEVFLKAAEFLNTAPENCLVVEDALSGIQAAAAGGMVSAGIGPAAMSGKATWPIIRVSDLVGILGELKYKQE